MIQIFLGQQQAEKQKAIKYIDAGATDFNVDETITPLESEVFNSLGAKGDSVVGKIEVQGSIPVELSIKVLETILPGLSYKKIDKSYRMDSAKPAFYTLVLCDTETGERWEYLDTIISKLDLNIAVGGYIKGNIDIIAKTYSISTGTMTGEDRGDSLRALFSGVTLAGYNISEDVEGVDISIDNGIEAKGSLNSLYNTKIRRTKQVDTKINIQKNEYEAGSFKEFKEKMIAGTPVNAKIILGTSQEKDAVTIEIPKMFITSNKRGDFKGASSHDMEMQASVQNDKKTHLEITFKEKNQRQGVETE